MERVLIGLLVLVFMIGTMLVAARLAVRRTGQTGDNPTPPDDPRQAGPQPGEPVRLADSAFRSALD